MKKDEGISDSTSVPLRWVFVSIGASVGCLATLCIGAFTVGGVITRNSLGQENLNQRVFTLEANDKKRIEEDKADAAWKAGVDQKLDFIIGRLK